MKCWENGAIWNPLEWKLHCEAENRQHSTAQRHNKHDDFIDVMPCYRENYLTTSKVLKIGSTLNIKNASYSLMLHTDLFCSYVADPATFLASNSCSGT